MAFQSPHNPQHLNSVQRLSELVKVIRDDAILNVERLPGLSDLLNEYASDTVRTPSKEDLIRRMIRVFKDSATETSYSQILSRYNDEERRLLNRFVVDRESASIVGQDYHVQLSSAGESQAFEGLHPQPDNFIRREPPPARHHSLQVAGGHPHQAADGDKPIADGGAHSVNYQPDFAIYDDSDNKRKVPVYFKKKSEDWRHIAENIPQIVCVPTSSYGVQQIVKHAKAYHLNVRASDYGHSWSPIFGDQAQILISTSDGHEVPMPPNVTCPAVSEQGECPTNLNTITFQGIPKAGWSRLVRVGTAVTNEQLRRWCNTQKRNLASAMPLNVSMVEITLGGSNATICHGAGRTHPSLSDLVHAIEYVDANGRIQKLSKDTDPEGMKAASGCFGLLGIITHITFELEPMAYAVMRPQKLHITEAIPLPPGRKHTSLSSLPLLCFFLFKLSLVTAINA